jgi:hypothetical protein
MGDMNGAITLFPADGGFSSRLTNGSFPALRCDDQVIAFQLRTSTGVSLLKYDITTGLTSTFSSSGTNMSPDYFPDC